MLDRDGFKSGFYKAAATLGLSKSESGEFLLKAAFIGNLVDTAVDVSRRGVGALVKAPYVGALTGLGLGGTSWLLLQKAKADQAKEKAYENKILELDRLMEDLEVSGVLDPEEKKPESLLSRAGAFGHKLVGRS
jgi:hypothetical protein